LSPARRDSDSVDDSATLLSKKRDGRRIDKGIDEEVEGTTKGGELGTADHANTYTAGNWTR